MYAWIRSARGLPATGSRLFVTDIAAHLGPLGEKDLRALAAVPAKADSRLVAGKESIIRHSREHGALQIFAVARLTGSRRRRGILEHLAVVQVPRRIVDRMHAVRTLHQAVGIEVPDEVIDREAAGLMAGVALDQLAGMTLELLGGDIVVGVRDLVRHSAWVLP